MLDFIIYPVQIDVFLKINKLYIFYKTGDAKIRSSPRKNARN